MLYQRKKARLASERKSALNLNPRTKSEDEMNEKDEDEEDEL